MASIGIDFGSSNTSASWLNPKSGCPEAILFSNDQVKLPSLLLATKNGFLVGNQAFSYLEEIGKLPVEQRFEMMENFVPCLKSLLEDDSREFFYDKDYSHQELLRIFVEEVIKQCKNHCGIEYVIDSVTFTHPVEFSQHAINVIRGAFENIGLVVEKSLTEPESAVLGYMINHNIKNNEGILVFDFGGGTIDVAFVKNYDGNIKVATPPKGSSHCGGNDIDFLIYEHFRNRIKKELGYDITQQGMIDNTVINCCRKLKEQFSGVNDYYEIPSLLIIKGKVHTYKFGLSRDAFCNIIYPKVQEAIDVAKQVVIDVKSGGYQIDRILLIGGSSRLTLVQDLLSELIDNALVDNFGEKDIAVALGALYDKIELNDASQTEETIEQEDLSEFIHPLKRLVNCRDGGGCFICGSEECYKLIEPRGTYRCLNCKWQGKNILISY